jgi:predicted acylesterase/phospholipase RssA
MKYLILGPGSMALWSIMGHVYRLHNDKQLDDLEEISGSSAGSLIALVYSIGRDNPEKMIDRAFEITDMSKIIRYSLKNLLTHYGLTTHEKFRMELSAYCKDLIGKDDITFREHYDLTKLKIHIPAFSLEKNTNDYFSVDISPNMSVLDAVCMSISIPLLFPPYKDHIDGSVIEAIPYIPFMNKEPEDVYAVRTSTNISNVKYTNLQSYIGYIFKIFHNLRHESMIQYPTTAIETSVSEMCNFKMTTTDRYKLFIRGYSISAQS